MLLLAALISACTRVEASRQPVEVDMANVDLHITTDVTLHIKQMRGRFTPVDRDVAYLDDKRSYSVFVDSGEVAIDLASLNALMARSMSGILNFRKIPKKVRCSKASRSKDSPIGIRPLSASS